MDLLGRLFEPDHVKLYSTKEFRALFAQGGLTYLETKTKTHQKIHIGEKQ
jgi:hypothetical protein